MNSAHQLLTQLFGPHSGLNSDWSVCAWCVSGKLYAGIFIVDEEDGTFSLVRSSLDADEMHAVEAIETVDAQFVPSLVERALNQVLSVKLAAIVEHLLKVHHVESSVEHPFYVNVPLTDLRCLAVGTANARWDCDLNHLEGCFDNLWNMPVDSSVAEVANRIAATVLSLTEGSR